MGNPLAAAFGDPSAPSTGLFGHPERIKDFGFRAIHLMTVHGKEIGNAFYGKRPSGPTSPDAPPAARTP